MENSRYLNLAEQLLTLVEMQCDVMCEKDNFDIDVKRTGSMLTLIFDNNSEIIVNLQKPVEEVWLATKFDGYHFRQRDGVWRTVKNDLEFFETLSNDASRQTGLTLRFVAT
jgi:CyaY protein